VERSNFWSTKFQHRHVWVYFSFCQCLILFLQCFYFRNSRGPQFEKHLYRKSACEHESGHWNTSWSCWIKNCGVMVTFSGMTSLLNFVKIYKLAQKLAYYWDTSDGERDMVVSQVSRSFLFRIICWEWILSNCMRVWTGVIWLKIIIGCTLFLTGESTLWFHKRPQISWQFDRLLA
jgi:hypothetical protein